MVVAGVLSVNMCANKSYNQIKSTRLLGAVLIATCNISAGLGSSSTVYRAIPREASAPLLGTACTDVWRKEEDRLLSVTRDGQRLQEM